MTRTTPITLNGETRPAADWAQHHNLPWSVVQMRVSAYGYTPAQALTEPLHTRTTAGRRGAANSPWSRYRVLPVRGTR